MAARYDKPERGPEKLAEVLARLFVARGWGQRSTRRELDDAWLAVMTEIVSAAAARRTVPGSVRKGVLDITVEGSALLAELTGFHKDALLAALKERLKGAKITALRFRPGKIGTTRGPGDSKGEEQ